jgi:hypothetical protein
MPIKTQPNPLPNKFPQAKLFLDDLQEIANILHTFMQEIPDVPSPAEETSLKLTCDGRECTTIDELPKILSPRKIVELEVARGWVTTSLFLDVDHAAHWYHPGNATDGSIISAFNQLSPIFEKRKRTFIASLRATKRSTWVAIFALLLIPSIAFWLQQKPVTINPRALAPLIATLLALLLPMADMLPVSSVLPRNSYDTPPLKKYLLEKVLPIVIGFVLGIASTLLTQLLIRMIWPAPKS